MRKMVGIVLLGVTTSGKSSIGRYVARQAGLRYISSGDIARAMDCDDTLNKGMLAPEDEMRRRIMEKIYDINDPTHTPYILDGCPRFMDQYNWLKANTDHKLVFINIDIPYSEVVARAEIRGRDDDNFGSILKKIVYHIDEIMPMVEYIKNHEKHFYTVSNNAGIGAKNDAVLAIVRSELSC